MKPGGSPLGFTSSRTWSLMASLGFTSFRTMALPSLGFQSLCFLTKMCLPDKLFWALCSELIAYTLECTLNMVGDLVRLSTHFLSLQFLTENSQKESDGKQLSCWVRELSRPFSSPPPVPPLRPYGWWLTQPVICGQSGGCWVSPSYCS